MLSKQFITTMIVRHVFTIHVSAFCHSVSINNGFNGLSIANFANNLHKIKQDLRNIPAVRDLLISAR